MERRLAAILAADVVGYSKLMAQDELATLALLKAHRAELFNPKVAEHDGRIIKLMGDGTLVEFSSVVDAVNCALAIQKALAAANEAICLRIGINLGDVIVDGDDIYGDGVNIAARLEALSVPGGICVSDLVHQSIRSKIDVAFRDIGEQSLKNIDRPVRAWQWSLHSEALRVTPPTDTKIKPDKPTIAILPFNNMSGDAEQEYFSDGLTEDIITELSRFGDLGVIARNSSFHFKAQSPNIQDVGRQLGARYIVEGSVRKAGNRVRITAQLVAARDGSHLWAERYDRVLEDIFDVQDEVVSAIAGAIPEQIERTVVRQTRSKAPESMTAFDHLLRGRWALHHTSDGLQVAIEQLELALEADPNYASAHALMSYAYTYGMYVLGHNPDQVIVYARRHAERALALDSEDAEINAAAAICYILSGEHERADAHSERAVTANPNDQFALYSRGLTLAYTGRAQEGLAFFQKTQVADPFAPDDVRADGFCDCLFMLGRYEDMLNIYRRWQGELPAFLLLVQSAAQSQLRDIEGARASVQEFGRRPDPKPDPKVFVACHTRMMQREEDRATWLEAYREAGLPV